MDGVGLTAILIGLIFLIKNIIENKDKLKNIKLNKLNINDLKKYRYLLFDYTFIIMAILVALLFTSTENMLKI